jgi:hypothetical protein
MSVYIQKRRRNGRLYNFSDKDIYGSAIAEFSLFMHPHYKVSKPICKRKHDY